MYIQTRLCSCKEDEVIFISRHVCVRGGGGGCNIYIPTRVFS